MAKPQYGTPPAAGSNTDLRGKEQQVLTHALLMCLVLPGQTAPASQPAWDRPTVLASGISPEQVGRRSYLEYARECIETLMRDGTDRYGEVRSPVLVSILDVRTHDCPENPLPLDETVRALRRERRNPAGANLYTDQPTLQAMCDLSRVTRDPRYARFARDVVRWYLDHLVDAKGLIWWGWHRHYDVYQERMTGHLGNVHEIHIQEALWPLLWEVNPGVVRREIEAIWTWHVVNKTTGEINRHDDGKPGCDFAFTAGELAWAFAFLYTRDHDPAWLQRAELLADYYWTRRNPVTGLIPPRPNAGSQRFDGAYTGTTVTGFYCHSLLRIHEITGVGRFRDQALAYLKAFATYGYDPVGERFWAGLALDGTPDLRPRVADGSYEQYEGRGPTDLWQPYAAGYEFPFAAAQVYAYAYERTRDPAMREAAIRWARFIEREWPPRGCADPSWYSRYARSWAGHGTYAAYYGRLISFLLHLHSLTGRPEYLAFARTVANEAISKLYCNGLFRGHPCKPYYEALDGVGHLLRGLIQLHEVTRGTAPPTFENW
jgi:hypothetical protein